MCSNDAVQEFSIVISAPVGDILKSGLHSKRFNSSAACLTEDLLILLNTYINKITLTSLHFHNLFYLFHFQRRGYLND